MRWRDGGHAESGKRGQFGVARTLIPVDHNAAFLEQPAEQPSGKLGRIFDGQRFVGARIIERHVAPERENCRSRLAEMCIRDRLMTREAQSLLQRLDDVTRSRHEKFGNTVFHLEPNVKDTPGGLRDCNVALWLSLLSSIDKLHDWPDPNSPLSAAVRKQFEPALDFLMSVRCFLHLRSGRDDNLLSWEAQEEAAKLGIGMYDSQGLSAADWMRIYFGHARSIHRTATQLLDEIPAAWSPLSRHFHNLRSRVSDADFSVVDGLVFLRQSSALQDPEVLLRLFHFVAHHDVRLSTTTENKIERVLPSLAATPPRGAELWLYLGEILAQPHAAQALRAMHSLRLLTLLLPELKAIDALVVRDFYHRFTVDEHSFLAIENLHRLRRCV